MRGVIPGGVLVGAILCGAHAALFSCGADVQHNRVRLLVLLTMVVGTGLVPMRESTTAGRRLLFAGAVIGVYWLSQALLTPLYPASPATIDEYFRIVWVAIRSGSC